MISKRFFLSVVIAIGCSLNAPTPATSETYPSRPVTMVLPFAAGGPTDTLARIIAARMQISLGQPVIIENVSGAAGTIGVGRVARAAPDGYTISVGPMNSHVLTGAIYKLPFDLLKDFEPVALLANNPSVIVSKKDVPAKDLKELIAWVKADQDKILVGTSGVGAATHLGGILFEKLTGTRVQFVPFRGTGPSMQALVAGQIDLIFDAIVEFVAAATRGSDQILCRDGTVAGSGSARHSTVARPDCHNFTCRSGMGCGCPKGTPKDIIGCHRAPTTRRHRAGDLSAPAPDTRSAGCLPQGRDREVVADRQGGGNQG